MAEMNFTMLEVDLSNKKTKVVDVTEEVRQFVGGRSLGAKILWNRIPQGADPLGEENVLYVGIGPITGFLGSVTNFSAKSPLTLLKGHANMNGHFGQELIYTGYNGGILFTGKSDKPVYLCIKDDLVEIGDASHLWGKSGLEAQHLLEKELKEEMDDQNFRCALIGLAGENLVRNADICHDFYHHAARLGMGAVMGSKKLKAIAIKGKRPPRYVYPDKLFELLKKVFNAQEARLYKAQHRRWSHTTSMPQRYYNTTEGIKNKQLGWDPICDLSNPVRHEQQYKLWNDSCQGCFVGCKVPYLKKNPPLGPCAGEFRHDNAGGWNANVMIPGYEAQTYLSSYVDYLGLDSEDVSGVVAWMMECYQRGLITQEDLGGIELTWGNLEAICALLKKIAYREGIGNILAEGLKIAPGKIGKGTELYAMTHKGTAITSYEPRGSMGDALALACTAVGELHANRGTPERIMYDSLTTCTFLRTLLKEIFGSMGGWAIPMLNAACGWDLTPEDWDKLVLRGATMERCYSMREGYLPERDDMLPKRFFEEAIYNKYGEPRALKREEFQEERKRVYRSYGLQADGTPSPDLLEELGLEFTVPVLEKQMNK
ncbi:MAG: aldehyde ferredoxin oxidoreductase C-terminal domain-containing protein [Desulfobacteria bacterium]